MLVVIFRFSICANVCREVICIFLEKNILDLIGSIENVFRYLIIMMENSDFQKWFYQNVFSY